MTYFDELKNKNIIEHPSQDVISVHPKFSNGFLEDNNGEFYYFSNCSDFYNFIIKYISGGLFVICDS